MIAYFRLNPANGVVSLLFGLMLAFAHPVFAGNPFIPGDMNGDAMVTIADMIQALQVVDQLNPAAQGVNRNGDVDHNDRIGLEEAVYISQKISGLRPAALYAAPVRMTSANVSMMPGYVWAGEVSPEVVTLSYAVNGGAGVAVDFEADGVFGVPLTLNVGANSICTKAADAVGDVFDEHCFSVVYDPVMVFPTPAQTKNYTLTGAVMSAAVHALSYTLNGGTSQPVVLQSMNGVSLFTAAVTLGPVPDNVICTRATDGAGQLISESCFSVLYAPVSVTSEDDSPSCNYTFTGTVSPEVTALSIAVNGGTGQTVDIGGGYSVPLVLTPGTTVVAGTATDAAGSLVSDFSFHISYLPVAVTSPSVTTAPGYSLTGTILPEVTSMSCSLNGGADQPVDIGGGALSIQLSLIPGENTICMSTATAVAGSAGTTCIGVHYDTGLPSSMDLIEAARAAGTISAEDAIVYKVLTAYKDPQLPAQYQGDDSRMVDITDVLGQAAAAAPTLSQAARDTLGRFFIPPFYAGSWYDIQATSTPAAASRSPLADWCNPNWPLFDNPCPRSGNWVSVDGVNLRVWYLKSNEAHDKPIAQRIVSLMEGPEAVWSKMTLYMERTPKLDTEDFYNGDDGRLDIALADMPAALKGNSIARGSDSSDPSSVYIMINRTQDMDTILFATVHEVMHAIQRNTKTLSPKKDYFTLMETTAQWGAHEMFSALNPNNRTDHKTLPDYLKRTNQLFNSRRPGAFAYGLYLFPMYLAKTFPPAAIQGRKIIKEMWDFTGTSDEIRAVDRALNQAKSSFRDIWPKFALAVWNQGPVANFKKWDKIVVDWPEQDSIQWDLEAVNANTNYPMTAELPSFSARYNHFTFSSPNVRSVVFMNGLNYKLSVEELLTSEDAPVTGVAARRLSDRTVTNGARVQAIIKKGGHWQPPEDWSMYPFKAFCREMPDERIEELVLIFSAGDTSGKTFSPRGVDPMLYATDVPCGPGAFKASISCDCPECESNVKKGMSVDWDYVPSRWIEARSPTPEDGVVYSPLEREYAFTGGTGTWTGQCQDGGGGGDLGNDGGSRQLTYRTINFSLVSENPFRGYEFYGQIAPDESYGVEPECTPGATPDAPCRPKVVFDIKSTFDKVKKKYTAFVAGTVISGSGDEFSTETEPPVTPAGGRTPMDYGGCSCPVCDGVWTCGGSWSLESNSAP